MRALAFGLAFALASLAAGPAEAATLLHPMFADHAVLQRDQPIPVYGTAKPGADVTLQLGNATATAHADKDGQWRATLPAMTAGGPYMLHAASGGDSQDIQRCAGGRCVPLHRPVQHAGECARRRQCRRPRSPPRPTTRCASWRWTGCPARWS